MIKKIIQNKLLFPEIIWERPVHFYKNQCGRILILAGSRGNANRASIVCETVFRSGTGIITLGFPDILKNLYKDFLPEQMTLLLPSTPSGTIAQKSKEIVLDQIKSSDVVLIGPGLSENSETIHLIWDVIINSSKTIIICDDAISAFIKGIEVLRNKEDEKFLISYFKNINIDLIMIVSINDIVKILNAAKLGDYPKTNIRTVEKYKEKILLEISNIFNITIIINDLEQVIIKEELFIINPKINQKEIVPNDILGAITASFVGQNPNKIIESIATGLYLINSAVSLAQKKDSDKKILSSDILREIPEAIKKAETA